MANRGKRSVALDLTQDAGREQLYKLVESADVFTTNLRTDARRKLGIERDETSEDELVALMLQEPRLIRRPLIEIDGELLPPISGSAKIQQVLQTVLQ